MGNSAFDVSKISDSHVAGRRDRQVTTITNSAPGYYWLDDSPGDGIIYSAGSSQRCLDTNHPWWYRMNRYRQKADPGESILNLDLGDSFAKESIRLTMPTVLTASAPIGWSSTRGWTGVVAPTTDYKQAMKYVAQGIFPEIPSSLGTDTMDLWSLGATAVARSIPDIPEFSLFRFIGELRAGLPKIPLQVLTKEKKLRNTGGEYLNVQFGILPLVSDLQDFLKALNDPRLRSAIKQQLNKEFRVRKTISKETTSTTTELQWIDMLSANGIDRNTGTRTTYRSQRIWSSCSFAYYQVTQLDQLLAELDDTMGGLGAVPTAIDIWNLVPWSWLVDWFANFNHVLTNLSYLGRDGLYLRRGYIMAHYSERQVSTMKGYIFDKPFQTTGEILTDRKYRVAASPFGFGLRFDGFDPFQLSILGALGVSRARI